MSAIVTLHGNIPEGESREFPVAFSGKLMWRIPGISLDRKQTLSYFAAAMDCAGSADSDPNGEADSEGRFGGLRRAFWAGEVL